MLEAALLSRKMASNNLFLTFVIHFMLDPGPNPVPEPEPAWIKVPIDATLYSGGYQCQVYLEADGSGEVLSQWVPPQVSLLQELLNQQAFKLHSQPPPPQIPIQKSLFLRSYLLMLSAALMNKAFSPDIVRYTTNVFKTLNYRWDRSGVGGREIVGSSLS